MKSHNKIVAPTNLVDTGDQTGILVAEITNLIELAQSRVASSVNSALVTLYWHIGKKITQDVLNQERAKYGEQIINHLAQQLQIYGRGFSARSLFKMVRFYKFYADEKILPTLSAQFSWSKIIELVAIEDPLKRQFYTEICHIENWSVRLLRQKISKLLYERTAISHKPEELIKHELTKLQQSKQLTQDMVFRDPYILDFLNLPANFSEEALESAILDDLSKFLQELGTDFCFIARQKRITIDNEDYYIDLLMYHRGLRRLIAIDLKLDKFKAGYKRQFDAFN